MMATDAGFRETLAYNCGPLFMDALKNPEVIEIMLNPDGMLWIERYGQDQEPIGTMEPVRSRAGDLSAHCKRSVFFSPQKGQQGDER